MFKKPPSNLKTSAPLRSSDRRKLKQRAVSAYQLSSEEGDALIPDGISSVKFSTHVNEPGTLYTHVDGTPMWFTIGKGSEDLLPTVYTLWKKQDLLPFLSTPSAVVPILIGGADLMIPGVIQCPPSLAEHQLVAIRQYVNKDGKPALSPPVAIGRMALPSDRLRAAGTEKGKAIHVIHTWKDHLWEMGSKIDIPEDTLLEESAPVEQGEESEEEGTGNQATPPPPIPPEEMAETPQTVSYTPQEVTELLNKALLQSISKPPPASGFPIPATIFYSNYLLPSRPAFPTLVLPPTGSSSDRPGDPPQVDTEITIKTSSHKSLTAFLKAAEKTGLLTLKPPQKQQPDVLITAINASHPNIISHVSFVTVKDVELTAAKKAAREGKETTGGSREVEIKELYKPHQASVDLFEGIGANKADLYTIPQIRTMLNGYIAAKSLVNQNDQAYINLDDLLFACVAAKGSKGKAKAKDAAEPEPPSQFMRRDELTKSVVDKMQPWYGVRAEGKEPVTKKGSLSPIQVATKLRQGRKAATLITGFEPFLVIDADEMAEDLRKTCAGATSVSPAAGKPGGTSMEVLVQGKQSKSVVDYLMAKGIPKKWIEVVDLSGKK
ncbi:unnamed protein product [Cyclocybe aegerita]|uniref:Eukaryotic translation initiation factor SUI1 family protein n=1 Tax=Cyclocybe aegerita TaxID=1973307 RepID=A0A8S0W4J4_CYCAE|nr:unnamed protein product [Cyclocybe aegerita]